MNTARGDLVDQPALLAELRSGHPAGAVLDAHVPASVPAESPLRTMETVVLSPNVAAQTAGAVRAIGFAATRAILAESAGERPLSVYNPQVCTVREALRLGSRSA